MPSGAGALDLMWAMYFSAWTGSVLVRSLIREHGKKVMMSKVAVAVRLVGWQNGHNVIQLVNLSSHTK